MHAHKNRRDNQCLIFERPGRNRSIFEDRFVRTDFCGQRSYSSIMCSFCACVLARVSSCIHECVCITTMFLKI